MLPPSHQNRGKVLRPDPILFIFIYGKTWGFADFLFLRGQSSHVQADSQPRTELLLSDESFEATSSLSGVRGCVVVVSCP